MYSRLFKPLNDKSFFIFGPRGVGKSFWLKKQFKSDFYVDLLNSETFNKLISQPSRIEQYIPQNCTEHIIIDEIQRIPELLNEVHRLIVDKNYKFILTGSSARKLRKKGVNLLAGRAITKKMYPFTSQELKEDFDFNKALNTGMLPLAVIEEDSKSFLSSYVNTYLREEIQQEGLTRNIGNFSRFLEAASFSQGSILNVSEVARDCSVERKVVENYFSILDDLMLSYKLPVFTKKAKRKTITKQKFYFFDVGVYRIIRPKGSLDKPEEIDGAALETLVLQELIALNEYYNLGYNFYYWHTKEDQEVDLVLYGEKGLFAFEIKRTNKLSNSDFKGLKLFKSDYPECKCYMLYCGSETLYENDITIMPLQLFFKKNPLI